MDFETTQIIDDYLLNQQDIFTLDEFYKYVKGHGGKITKIQAEDILNSTDLVFSLVDNQFITRAGVFIGRWFSFKPSKEEIQKGYIVLGHRCMPFINPEISPDKINVVTPGFKEVAEGGVTVSMNLAMDLFALYGEGYVIPYIFSDHSNKKAVLSNVQYNMPSEITLTGWSLKDIAGDKKFNFGDRILARIVNWEENVVELSVIKADDTAVLSQAEIEREEWYSHFENGFLESFDRNGPGNSIEQQLAFLFLEHQEELCCKNCGSIEEFLKHTKKIGFSYYGVESRIWRTGESVPFVGPWNSFFTSDAIFNDMSMTFTPQVMDAYLEDFINSEIKKKTDLNSHLDLSHLVGTIFPQSIKMTNAERKMVLLNIEKRFDILKKQYDAYADRKLAPVRHRIVELFSQVSSLLCSIGCSGLKLEDFPQQELVVVVQLFVHIARIIEEMENFIFRDNFPVDDISLSLEGMEDAFEDVGATLHRSLEENTYKNITIV